MNSSSVVMLRIPFVFFLAASTCRPQAPLTFYRNIAPITYQYCASCHRSGEAGPFPLLTYNDVKKRAGQIVAVTRRRYMPPWLPEPGYGHFEGERRLSDAQIRMIQQWVAGGLREGSPADAPAAPRFTEGWQLGQPDLIVQASQPFTLRADGPDVFWNFVLRVPVSETRYVKAIEIRPGNPRIVHHANLLVDRTRSSRSREASPGAGFEGMDLDIEADTFEPDSHFLFWKPGSVPYVEPEGLAWRLDKGNDLVLNVHLQTAGKIEEIQPSVGLYFTTKPQTRFPMLLQLEHDGKLDIRPGDKDFMISDDFQLPMDVDVLAVYPHAHYLGKVLEGYATLPDGTRRWLVKIPNWDLNWQAVYRYEKPVFLPKGSVISMRYQYDNSAENPRNPNHPPRRVVGGNQSTDEMGHLWLQVLPRGSGAAATGGNDVRDVLQEAIMRHRLEKYPADFSAHFNLGALMLARGKAPEAIPYLQDALKLEPHQAAALNGLGAALLENGRTSEAIEQFRKALTSQPGYTNARYNLANALADEGHLDDAAAGFREVLKENADDDKAREHLFLVLVERGNSLAQQGNVSGAAEDMREAVSIHPEDADLHNNLGVILAHQGDRLAAIAEFEAALKANPSLAAAQRNLDIARQTP
jgi:tetratricopeptide (TPR) repeat protein